MDNNAQSCPIGLNAGEHLQGMNTRRGTLRSGRDKLSRFVNNPRIKAQVVNECSYAGACSDGGSFHIYNSTNVDGGTSSGNRFGNPTASALNGNFSIPSNANLQMGSHSRPTQFQNEGMVDNPIIDGQVVNDCPFAAAGSYRVSMHLHNTTNVGGTSSGIPTGSGLNGNVLAPSNADNVQVNHSGLPQARSPGTSIPEFVCNDFNPDQSGWSQFLTESRNIPIHSELNRIVSAPNDTQMGQFGQPQFHPGDTSAGQTVPSDFGNIHMTE